MKTTTTASDLSALTAGSTVRVNGKKFTVASVGSAMVTLTGSRGGWAALVANIHSGIVSLATERGPKAVASFSVAL